ncbi:phosphatidylserine/phosphatidylglycerophosphate/cardiolipin synthase family protein [Solibacillus silvestris]
MQIIVTYNINTYEPESELIKELRKVRNSTPITLVLNIPARREDYIKKKTGQLDQAAVKDAKNKIKYTLNILERSKFGDLNVYFNFDNHSKLIMTDTVAYIGSQNFSDASKNKFELGFFVNDQSEVSKINYRIFEKIKNRSILYATFEYAVVMEEIAEIMRGLLQNIRQDIFTMSGDEPYIPEVEVIDIDNAYFPKQKWEEFKELHYRFEDLVEKLVNDYPLEFNKGKADKKVGHLRNLVEDFASELDELADFINDGEELMMWSKFEQIDIGEDVDTALEGASDYVRNYKHEKFRDIEDIADGLIQSFNGIEQCINDIETVIDEIKDSMINKSVYQNLDLIKNY